MAYKDFKRSMLMLWVVLLLLFSEACQCDKSDSSDNDHPALDASDETIDVSYEDIRPIIDGGFDSEDNAIGLDGADIEAEDSESDKLEEEQPGSSSNKIPSDGIVTPAEVTPEMLDEYRNEPINSDDLSSLQPDSCGYTMTVDFVGLNTSSTLFDLRKEARIFDEAGNLLILQGDDYETEIKYDTQARPITIWVKRRDAGQTGAVTAIEYRSDGSAISKIIDFSAISLILNRSETCDYLVFDDALRFIEYLSSYACDDTADKKVEMTYRADGKPLSYRSQNVNVILDDIVWEYFDTDRKASATWYDGDSGESVLDYGFDTKGKLVSIGVDYRNDGDIDEITNIRYDQRGNMVRIATDLDQDGVVDLLRVNTYDQNGNLVKRELRNLMSSIFDVNIFDSDFEALHEYVPTATAMVSTYSYDNKSKLIESVTEVSDAENSYEIKRETFHYDTLGRLVEQQVSAYLYEKNDNSGDIEDSGSSTTTCTFDYSCDNRPDETSELRSCDLDIIAYDYLFPYRAIREIPFHSNYNRNRSPNDLNVFVGPEAVLGIPWY